MSSPGGQAAVITYVLSLGLIEVQEYLDAAGRSPFARWFRGLSVQTASKVATALERLADGNLSNTKSVGAGVHEYRINFGPGYRIYFGQDGNRLVILLAGGEKKRQQPDICNARIRWEDYKRRKV